MYMAEQKPKKNVKLYKGLEKVYEVEADSVTEGSNGNIVVSMKDGYHETTDIILPSGNFVRVTVKSKKE